MAAKLRWIDRAWRFDFPVEIYPDILERLRGTPARIDELVLGLAPNVLTRKDREGAWSILENIGHLTDTEVLPLTRVDQFLAGAMVLTAADMKNVATNNANHNGRAVAELTGDFRRERMRLMEKLDSLTDADFARTSRHPRLDMPMRLVDLCLFTADHDDYHLARMRELMLAFG